MNPFGEGNIYQVTTTFERPISIDGEETDSITFVTIQPDEKTARERNEWHTNAEFDADIDTVEVDPVDLTLPELFQKLADSGQSVSATPTVQGEAAAVMNDLSQRQQKHQRKN